MVGRASRVSHHSHCRTRIHAREPQSRLLRHLARCSPFPAQPLFPRGASFPRRRSERHRFARILLQKTPPTPTWCASLSTTDSSSPPWIWPCSRYLGHPVWRSIPLLKRHVLGSGANLDKMPPDLRFNSLPEDRRSAPPNIPLRAVTFMPFAKSSCVKR
jgi:hypothetical protein